MLRRVWLCPGKHAALLRNRRFPALCSAASLREPVKLTCRDAFSSTPLVCFRGKIEAALANRGVWAARALAKTSLLPGGCSITQRAVQFGSGTGSCVQVIHQAVARHSSALSDIRFADKQQILYIWYPRYRTEHTAVLKFVLWGCLGGSVG